MAAYALATSFVAVRTEGGLLPPDLLARIRAQDPDLGGMKPEAFGLASGDRVSGAIAEAWPNALVHWQSFERIRERLEQANDSGTTETRAWIQNLLRELGYGRLVYRGTSETWNNQQFVISHRAGEADNAPPVHIVAFGQDLDNRTGGRGTRSPHAAMQAYLNETPHLWGIVTNGLTLRLVRENRQLDRPMYIEVDLKALFEGELFTDFQLVWPLLHRSRFAEPGQTRTDAWIEQWRLRGESDGSRALTHLREGVERAIRELGQGLLEHPRNSWLQQQLDDGTSLSVDDYYRQLLRLVYRLLFLLVAEERDLLFDPKADRTARQRYDAWYSVSRLRDLAPHRRHRDAHHGDLWESLLVVFDALASSGQREAGLLGLRPLGGGLFDRSGRIDIVTDPEPGIRDRGPLAGRVGISNQRLLAAIRHLSEFQHDQKLRRRVNYRDMDVEELGGVYEGLLEVQPALRREGGRLVFDLQASGERKQTGSYYTPASLVNALLDSALDPVIERALNGASTPEARRRALLELNVCDPACGSGHFLLGAARRIGKRIAEIDAGEGNDPTVDQLRHGKGEAIRHCVYGVDKNPLAIDLCKVALWIESHEPGAPIGFLDHHVKRGDSLVGVFDLDVLQDGIPDDAYKPVTGDDKTVANDLKKRNRAERSKLVVQRDGTTAQMHAMDLFAEGEREDILKALAGRLHEIDAMPEATADVVRAKADAYAVLQARDDWRDLWTACDLWTWAFFAPLRKPHVREGLVPSLVPSSGTVRQMVERGPGNIPRNLIGAAVGAGQEIGFFHWRLAFPDVFGARDRAGGFDAVLGNPPWERVKLQEKEFFAEHDEDIATAPNKAARDRLIKKLPETNPALAEAFEQAKREAENASLFMRSSGRFTLTGRGDVNLYSVFAEQFRTMLAPTGRAGVIVPTGIATDDTNKYFIGDLVARGSLASIYDFENRENLFHGVGHGRFRFSLITMSGRDDSASIIDVAFLLTQPEQRQENDRRFHLTAEDISLFNPNTRTFPMFRFSRDAAITKAIYHAAPVLVNESEGDNGNSWGVWFKSMFHMSNDSHYFRTGDELERDGAQLGDDRRFREARNNWLPLYEAKMIHHFNHRFGDFSDYPDDARTSALPNVPSERLRNPNYSVTPRYWVPEAEIARRADTDRRWFLGFRDIARSTDERTAIFSIVPYAAVGHTLSLLFSKCSSNHMVALFGTTNSLVFDFVSRQKMGGTHMAFGLLKQLPVLPPETYTEDLLDRIVPRVLELTYTAWDMQPFARDLGYEGDPFIWDEERRARLRAELDGIYAHLYGISRDDFAYILDTFPIVEKKDIAAHGEYRTKRLCLEAYDHFATHPAIAQRESVTQPA